MYICSGISSVGALLGISFIETGSLWQIFLVQGVLVGIANAFGSQPALVVVGQHFVRRRAFVMGIVAGAGSIGGVCFPIVLAKLADLQRVGYAWSLRVVAVIIAYASTLRILVEAALTRISRLCYFVAILISFTNRPKRRMSSLSVLFDLEGFTDRRYAVLAVGAFVTMLGQFVPYYYISNKHSFISYRILN